MISRSIQWTVLCGFVLGAAACGTPATTDAGADVHRTDTVVVDTGGSDVQGRDVQGMDAQGTDAEGPDVVGSELPPGDGGVGDVASDGGLDGATGDGASTDGATTDAVISGDGAATDVASGDTATGDVATGDSGDGASGDSGIAGCPTPVRALATTDHYAGMLTGTSVIPSSSCQPNTSGPENVFTLHITTSTQLTFSTADPSTNVDTVISIRTTCGDLTSEVACDDDSGPGTQSTLTTTLAPGDYFVIVDAYNGNMGSYVLSVSPVTTPTNVTCAAATTLTPGTELFDQRTPMTGVASTACDASDNGTQAFYSLTIPVGMQATISASELTDQVIVARVLESCTAAACLAYDAESASTASVNVVNTETTPKTVIVTVSGTDGTMPVLFNIAATTSVVPYAETTTAGSCDTLTSAAMMLPDVTGDDSASPIMALPFAFQFFGAAVADYSVTSNGFAQLWATAAGSPSTEWRNAAIPSTGDPNGFIAPFWDDLVPAGTGTASVQTFGTAPNRHLTIEWTNWSLNGDVGALVRLQAKLFETTNVIEFHYCTLTEGSTAGRVTGNSATVGIENAAGSNGAQHSLNTAGSVSTATAIRYTPAS